MKIFLIIAILQHGEFVRVEKEIGTISAANIETCNQMKRQMEFTYFPPEGMSVIFCEAKP